jgi:signal transduction histidine kinase
MFSSLIEPWVARLLPDNLARGDVNTRRRARLVVLFSFTIFLCGPGYGAIYLVLGMHVSALGALVAALVLFVTPFAQRRTGSVLLGAHLVSAGCYAALALVTAPTGGLAAPAVAWLALVPVTGLMLGGKNVGRLWTVVSVLTVALYFVLDATGRTPDSEVPTEWLRTLRLAVTAGLVLLIALLAWLYESNKDLMLAQLEATNAQLLDARDVAETAHREARRVLDTVAEGLLLVDREGQLHGERSRAAQTLLGETRPGQSLWQLFAAQNADFAMLLESGWVQLLDGLLSRELLLAQLPSTCRAGERTFAIKYEPLAQGDSFAGALVVVSDITLETQAREVEAERNEQLELLRWITRDGAFVQSSYRELQGICEALAASSLPWPDQQRLLHTLKGNASLLGLSSLARHCHELEQEICDAAQTQFSERQHRELAAAWRAAQARIQPLLGTWHEDSIVVERDEYARVLSLLHQRAPELHGRMLRWSWESSETCLARLSKQARALAARLAKRELVVKIEDAGTWLPPSWRAFWASTVHLLRNAIDHGIESPEERRAAGKAEHGTLCLRALRERGHLIIEVEDDGRGIDWQAVEQRARSLGLPVGGPRELEAALFADGLSTRSEVSEWSGRGVGMSAVLANCHALGGSITIRSERQRGTCVRISIPVSQESLAA